MDISGQKRTEKALAESEERLSLAVKGGDLGFWDWDIESDELVFNERWAEMLEYEFDELRERFDIWERRLHPDDREAAQAAIWNHVAGKAPEYRAEFRLKVRSGGWRWFVGQGRISSRSPDGRPLRMTGVMYDINERKMTEQGLTMINECMLGFGPDPEENLERLTDLAGKILQADAAFYNRPDAPPYCWTNTWAPDLKREWAPLEKGHISESLFSSRGQKTIVLHNLQDSRFASTDPDVNAFGLRAYAGQAVMIEDRPVAVLATLFRRDFKPNNSNLRLFGIIVGAMRVEEERRMAKEQIVKARDSAEHANRSKSEFLANMSHEIRTPLNGIFGMLQLVRGSELDEEQAEYVETALNSGRNLLRVINDVLDFSKMEAGMLLFENEPFNIGSTIREVMDTFTVAAREKDLRLDISLDKDMPEVLIGDEARIRQVLFNLLGNAIKFTNKGEVSVRAFTLPAPDGKQALHLTITDTGIGIPPDKIQQVFTAFSQADGSHARRYGGTGLGLGIVHRLVSLMGGHIHVDSEPGQGTSIHVFMLVSPGDGKLAPAKITTTPGRDPAAAMTVLLAEDERVNRISVTRQLEKMGHSVICAENGPTVLDKLRKNQVDVVLMDIQMPGMDGLEVTGILRSDPEFAALADVPIVALTAHAMKGDREKFLAAGMDDYLAKPVEFSDLAAILAEIRPRKQV
ncbi:hybrid sensor histidine kinase/response regulator [Pseudodesulfovibrio tunisiensis]|uniref:hybrid sensor histidine kinase/response regulator n=1 Tax=Pseudodesulfovibrio tunisiensis TaxID=463192 RepID=UPI001FB3E7D3|nr:PAS domain-containing hybrid sensor histidine kinase/response regulator [Pseudodesulfovibrio tunisiensis]